MNRSPSLENLKRTLYALAVIPIVAGAATVLSGSNSIPGGDPNASVESELRFYSVWWIGAGLFIAWLAPRVAERTRELRVFCALLFLGGLSRVIAAIDAGWPRPFYILLMGVELAVAVILVAWQARATAAAGRRV